MIKIPILVDYDQRKVIGSMTIDEAELLSTPDYCFVIGYAKQVDGYSLKCVSMELDSQYYTYLKDKYKEDK